LSLEEQVVKQQKFEEATNLEVKKIRVEYDAAVRTARDSRPLQYLGLITQADQALRSDNALRARFLLKSQPAMLSMSDHENRLPDLRGFEWRYLRRYLNSERFHFEGHSGVVHAVAVSRDSKWAASVGDAKATGQDSAIRVWNLETGEL